jgi:hypothetical protein
LLNGRLTYLPLTAFQGKQLILCCLPSIAETDAWLIDSQVNHFHECEAVLAVLVPGDFLVGQSWVRPPHEFRFPFLTDPLRRMGRTLRLSPSLPSHRGETLFFDRHSRLQFRLGHDLNLRGISTVLEIAESDFCQSSPQKSPKFVVHSDHLQLQQPKTEAPMSTYTLK